MLRWNSFGDKPSHVWRFPHSPWGSVPGGVDVMLALKLGGRWFHPQPEIADYRPIIHRTLAESNFAATAPALAIGEGGVVCVGGESIFVSLSAISGCKSARIPRSLNEHISPRGVDQPAGSAPIVCLGFAT